MFVDNSLNYLIIIFRASKKVYFHQINPYIDRKITKLLIERIKFTDRFGWGFHKAKRGCINEFNLTCEVYKNGK